MGKVSYAGGKVGMEGPVTGIKASELAVGSIVKFNVAGQLIDFYIAHHNYESGLNGTGRTLLREVSPYSSMQWNSSQLNTYSGSLVDKWLNETFFPLLDPVAQEAIETTKFYYTVGGGSSNSTITSLERSVFILSATEMKLTDGSSFHNVEGSGISLSQSIILGSIDQWTRSPQTNSSNYTGAVVAFHNWDGRATTNTVTKSYNVVPCFTIPANALFDENTLQFKGVY